VVGAGGEWSTAGIQIAESMDCVIAFNTSVKNKDGIAFREQGPRFIDGRPYYNRGNIVVGNVSAFNQGHQLGFWYDDAFFGWHPGERDRYKTLEAFDAAMAAQPERIHDPLSQDYAIDRNLYFGAGSLFLYGVPWRPRHLTFDTLDTYRQHTGFERHSVFVDPSFVDADADNYRFTDDSPAHRHHAGWHDAPEDVAAWIQRLAR
jgi:hypothetical protein